MKRATINRRKILAHTKLNHPDLSHKDVLKVISTVFDFLKDSMAKGLSIDLRGIGNIRHQWKERRMALNGLHLGSPEYGTKFSRRTTIKCCSAYRKTKPVDVD